MFTPLTKPKKNSCLLTLFDAGEFFGRRIISRHLSDPNFLQQTHFWCEGSCILTMSMSVIYVWVCKCHCVSVYMQDIILLYRAVNCCHRCFSILTRMSLCRKQCCVCSTVLYCGKHTNKKLHQLVWELFCYNYREGCTVQSVPLGTMWDFMQQKVQNQILWDYKASSPPQEQTSSFCTQAKT